MNALEKAIVKKDEAYNTLLLLESRVKDVAQQIADGDTNHATINHFIKTVLPNFTRAKTEFSTWMDVVRLLEESEDK